MVNVNDIKKRNPKLFEGLDESFDGIVRQKPPVGVWNKPLDGSETDAAQETMRILYGAEAVTIEEYSMSAAESVQNAFMLFAMTIFTVLW